MKCVHCHDNKKFKTKTKTDRIKAKYFFLTETEEKAQVRTFRKPVVGVVETPHGQFLQRQDVIILCADGLHLSREEDGQLPR